MCNNYMKVTSWIKNVLSSLLFFLVLFNSVSAGAAGGAFQESPNIWLKSMSEAAKKLSYKGYFVYQQGGGLESLVITRNASQNKESIVYMDGLHREVLIDKGSVTYLTPNNRATRFDRRSFVPIAGKFSNIASNSNYVVDYASKHFQRIAGRETVVLSIKPADGFRYGYKLWLDTKTSLPLKSTMLDRRNNILETLQCSHIQLGGDKFNPQVIDQINPRNEQVIEINPSTKQSGIWGWETGWLPKGFILKNMSQRPSPVNGGKTDAAIYSDGVASFSIFVEPNDTNILDQESKTIGTLAAISKIFRKGNRYFNVTVVGDVPLSTAERVAVNVRPKKSSGLSGLQAE